LFRAILILLILNKNKVHFTKFCQSFNKAYDILRKEISTVVNEEKTLGFVLLNFA
jgi:hypothetical protein